MRIQHFIEQATAALRQQGGFTISAATGQPMTEGFAVGLGRAGAVAVPVPRFSQRSDDELAKALANVIVENAGLLAEQPNVCLGGWVDGNDVAWLEPSAVYASREHAFNLAAGYGEQAIFDLGAKVEIPVAGAVVTVEG